MSIAISALCVQPAPVASQASLLGTPIASAYHHLYDEAGQFSRPNTVRRGVTRLYCPEFESAIADRSQRSADLASSAVSTLLRSTPTAGTQVQSIMHTQCTLDRQILGSNCLRIQYDHYPDALSAVSFGQLGTSALPTLFVLANHNLAQQPGLGVSITACDQWIAPFYRRIPGVVTYGDGAGACVVFAADKVHQPVAKVESVALKYRSLAPDLWSAAADEILDRLQELASECVGSLTGSLTQRQREDLIVIGDRYHGDLERRVAENCGLRDHQVRRQGNECHMSSFSLLASIDRAVTEAVREQRDRTALVWTASLSGHAGAMLVHCSAQSVQTDGAWYKTSTNVDAI